VIGVRRHRTALNTAGWNLKTCGPGSWAFVRFAAPGLTGILGTEPSHVTEETTVHPAISLFLARARIADMHDQTRRGALARTASRGRRGATVKDSHE